MSEFSNVMAAERCRTGNYGNDEESVKVRKCPICGCVEPIEIYLDKYGDCFGCYECVVAKDIYEVPIDKVDWEYEEDQEARYGE